MPNLKTSVGRLRLLGMLEGVSFLLLMGVAMPLKYLFDMPHAVKWPGWIHGLLFIVYCMAILTTLLAGKIPFWKAAVAFVASLLPFGPFLLDRKLLEDELRETASLGEEVGN
jgi:integral membrane protein